MRELIDKIYDEGLRGTMQEKATILRLLAIDPESDDAAYLRKRAHEFALAVSDGCACVGGCIGIDFRPCPMNCSFCSFGEKWGLVEDEVVLSLAEIVQIAREYIEAGVNKLTLRSTEFYDVGEICKIVREIRREVPGIYEINLNTGELSAEAAQICYEAGASSAYHVLRLREGIDTPFNPDIRKASVRVIAESPLKLNTSVEPIGVEHTDEEIADALVFALSLHPNSLGMKPRVNVPGTPFEGMPALPDARIAQLAAIIRLSAGATVHYVSCHPGESIAIGSGANGSNVERGATPHSTSFDMHVWKRITPTENAERLAKAGFSIGLIDCDPRFAICPSWWQPEGSYGAGSRGCASRGSIDSVSSCDADSDSSTDSAVFPNPTYIADDGVEYLHTPDGPIRLKLV